MKYKRKNFAYYDITKKIQKKSLYKGKWRGDVYIDPYIIRKKKFYIRKIPKIIFTKRKRTPKKNVYERKHVLVMQKKKIDDTKENKRGTIRKKI